MYIVITYSDDVTEYVTKQWLKIISIINWFVFVCFSDATKNYMQCSNILDKATIPAWCFNRFDFYKVLVEYITQFEIHIKSNCHHTFTNDYDRPKE